MKNEILKVIANSLNIDLKKLTDEMGPGDIPEWDSLGHQNLIMALENKYKIKLDIDEVLEMETVEEIIDILQAKVKTL